MIKNTFLYLFSSCLDSKFNDNFIVAVYISDLLIILDMFRVSVICIIIIIIVSLIILYISIIRSTCSHHTHVFSFQCFCYRICKCCSDHGIVCFSINILYRLRLFFNVINLIIIVSYIILYINIVRASLYLNQRTIVLLFNFFVWFCYSPTIFIGQKFLIIVQLC